MRFLLIVFCVNVVSYIGSIDATVGNDPESRELIKEHVVRNGVNLTALTHFSSLLHHISLSNLQHLNLTALAHLKLPHSVLHGNATNHWCCNVPTTKKIIQSHSQLIFTKQVKDRVSHHHCGFLGLSRCASHHYYYVSVPAYKTTYTSRTVHTTCPSQNLVCCKDYILLADNCIPLSEIPNIKDDLIKLQNANIPLGK